MSAWMQHSFAAAESPLTASQKDAAVANWLKAAKAASDTNTLFESWKHFAQVFSRLLTPKRKGSLAHFWQGRLQIAREFGREGDVQAIEGILIRLT